MGQTATDYKVFELVGHGEEPPTAGRIAELTGLATGAVTGRSTGWRKQAWSAGRA